MKNKKLWIAAAAVVAVIALMLGIFLATRPEVQQGSKVITVTVVHKDKTEVVKQYRTDAEYLGAFLAEEGLIQGDEGQYGLMIHTVDGEKADWNVDQGWWQVFVGDTASTVGISQIPVTDGGSYKLEYTVG